MFLTWLIRKPAWDRPVATLNQVPAQLATLRVGFVRDLVQAGSVGFVEDAVEHVGLFLVAKKAGGQRFIIDARASNLHFFETSTWTASCRGLCHVEFHDAP